MYSVAETGREECSRQRGQDGSLQRQERRNQQSFPMRHRMECVGRHEEGQAEMTGGSGYERVGRPNQGSGCHWGASQE